jgi:ribosomal protein L3 glutamine methyltransferase
LNLEQKIKLISEILENSGIEFGQEVESAEDEAALIVLKGMNIDVKRVLEDDGHLWNQSIDEKQNIKIDQLVQHRIASRIPFAYIVKESWFAGNRFYIDDRALIPRSFLGEWIEDRFEPWINADNVHSILDLCTGSGCIAISCALSFPDAKVTASDIDADALEVAKKNVENYEMQERVLLCQGDGFENIEGRFDLIVSNPPYVSDERMATLPEEFLKEPDKAFRGGSEGLEFIVPMLVRARNYLTESGVVIIESGSASHALEQRYPNFPFTWISTEYDEMVVFVMTAAELDQFALME